MASLKDIRQRIKAVKNIQKVTNAMKMVAAATLRRAQTNMEQARPYARRINGVLEHLLPAVDRSLNQLLEVREANKIGFVIVTGDRGLCGGFNTNIIRTATTLIDEYDRDDVVLICVGKKGLSHFLKREYKVIGQYSEFWRELSFHHAAGIVDQITELYLEHNLDKVVLIYNEFKNVVRQEVVTQQFLPLVLSEDVDDDGSAENFGEFMFEPSEVDIVNSLVPRHLNVQVWQALLESNAAEQAARMNAMGAATENAAEMISTLTLDYNKARQAAITKELLEIVSGADALVK